MQDKPGAKALQPSEAPSVEFENVSFSYQPNAPVLKDVSFKIEGGQTLALVGATGSGKSSLLRLLFRFYDPTSGVIKIDGQAVGEVTQKSLRAAMAVVPQDTVLFNDTILYNLRSATQLSPNLHQSCICTSKCKFARLMHMCLHVLACVSHAHVPPCANLCLSHAHVPPCASLCESCTCASGCKPV